MEKRIALGGARMNSTHGDRKWLWAFAFGLLCALGLSLGACQWDPAIKGSKKVTVGQELVITVEQGPGILQNDFELEDSSGRVYGPNDSELAYRFVDEKEVEFKIPFGMATGIAKLRLGADGRSQGYTITLTVVRLAALLDEKGFIHAINTSTGNKVGAIYLGHGAVTARLAADGNRIIATADGDGAVHFLNFDGNGLRPFTPSIEGVGTGTVDAVFIPEGALVATDQGLAVIKQGDSGTTVLDGFLDVPPLRGLAGGEGAGRVVALAAPSEDATNVGNEIYVVDLKEDGPVVRENPVDIGGTPGGAGHMVLSRDGSHLYVVNRADDTVTPVVLSETNEQVESAVILPLEQISQDEQLQHKDPVRARLSLDGKELIVLCGGSRSLVRYDVAESGLLQQKGTLMLGGLPFDVGFSGNMAFVIVDNSVKKVDLSTAEPTLTTVNWKNTAAALTIMLQP